MSGVLRTVGKVAGVVAMVAAFVPGGQPVALIASAVSAGANVGASLLAKPPPARGSVTGITVGSDQPMPFLIGETYYGGSRIQQVGYGPTIDKVPNPYGFIVDVYSGAGPVAGLVATYADFAEVPFGNDPNQPFRTDQALGYARGFLWRDVQTGQTPEPEALWPQWAGAPGWGPDYRLSGYAAIAWSLLFDRKGKVFASGVPQFGAVWRGQLVWDPRKDGTYPGGQGAQRWAKSSDTAGHDAARATWAFAECPGLVGLKYALGAYHRDSRVAGSTYQKVAGIGLPIDGVIVEDFVHLANICDANGWKVGGVVMEPSLGGQSTRWQNLCDILAAGGAQPCWRGGRLGLKVSGPRVALDTITEADLADDEIVVSSGLGWEERLNTLIPKYRSRDHKWEYVASTKPVSIPSYVSIDGEVKREERQYNLVQQGDQAAQLCAYELLDRRELGEIEIVVKPRLRKYGPGDLLIVDLPNDGLVKQPCVIMKRQPLPDRMAWRLVLSGETPEKHAFALGRTATPPPIPALRTTEDLDGIAAPVESTTVEQLLIQNSSNVGGAPSAADAGDDTATIIIPGHQRSYADRSVTVDGAALPGLALSTFYYVYYDDADRAGGAVTYQATSDYSAAFLSAAHPARHFVGSVQTPAAGGQPSDGGGATPPGGGGIPIRMPDD